MPPVRAWARGLAILILNLYWMATLGLELAWRLTGDLHWWLALWCLALQWWLALW